MASTTQDTTGYSVEFACSICGRKRSYPDEMVLSDDGLFRCTVGNGCDERTAYSVDRERAAFRPRPEMVPPKGGPLPIGDVRDTEEQFIDDAYAQSIALLGWRGPGQVLADTMDVLPYRAGSPWTMRGSGTGGIGPTVSAVAGGVTMTTGMTGPTTQLLRAAGYRMPSQLTGKGYAAFSFALNAIPTVSDQFMMTAGLVSSGAFVFGVGAIPASSANFFLAGGVGAASAIPLDTAAHKAEMWWTGGFVRARFDGGAILGPLDINPAAAVCEPMFRLFRGGASAVTGTIYTAVYMSE